MKIYFFHASKLMVHLKYGQAFLTKYHIWLTGFVVEV